MSAHSFTETHGCRIFFSSIPDGRYYDHDEELRDQLEKGLSALQRQNLISVWHDGKLKGGKTRDQEIAGHLEAAEIILLLLSSDFLASDFCYAQMLHAMSRHDQGEALVIPIFLRPTDGWEALPFGRLQPLPIDKMAYPFEASEWCYKIAKDLRSIIKDRYALVAPLVDPPSTQLQIYQDALTTFPPAFSSLSMIYRSKQVEEIARCLKQDDAVALIMTGLAGSGKSVLASQVYSFVQKQEQTEQGLFAGEPLWFHVDETTRPMDVVASLCSILGRPFPSFNELVEIHATVSSLAVEFFHIIRETPRLIIFDQFEVWLNPQTALAYPENKIIDEWLRLLNTYSQNCAGRLLLTSRFYPHGVLHDSRYVQEYKISGLERSESIQLLRKGNIPTIERATNRELDVLIQRCQGHAQTLAWLHELFKRNASFTLSDLLHQPYYETWWIDPGTSEMLQALYAHSLSQEQREMLLAFSVYRKAVPFEAALAIVEPEDSMESRRFAGEQFLLVDLSLLQAHGNGLYRIHPAVADFMHGYFEKHDKYRWLQAHRRAARYYQNQFQDIFLLTEFNDLLHVVEATWHLCRAERHEEAYCLVQKTELFGKLHRLGGNSILLDLYLQLLTQKNWLRELPLEAQFHHEMGEIRSALGQPVEALQEYRHALSLFRQTALFNRVVEALNNMGAMHRWLKHSSEAYACYQEALRICNEAPIALPQKGTTFNNLGRLSFEWGKQALNSEQANVHYQQALEYYELALVWYRENKLAQDEPLTVKNIGEVYRALRETERAREYYWHALQLFQEQGNRRGEGGALNDLALLYHKLSQGTYLLYVKEARTCLKEALRIFREVGDRRQEITTLRNLGRFCLTDPELAELQRYTRSMACFFVAKKLALLEQDIQIPAWIEETIRRGVKRLSTQSCEEFLLEIEEQAEQIVEDMLLEDVHQRR